MSAPATLLAVYLLGGLTFLPLVLAAALVYAFLSVPTSTHHPRPLDDSVREHDGRRTATTTGARRSGRCRRARRAQAGGR